jgi:hypothetical protein
MILQAGMFEAIIVEKLCYTLAGQAEFDAF